MGLFAAEGLSRREAVFLSGTASHLAGLRRALCGRGVDVESVLARRQLVLSDVEETMAELLVDGMPDTGRFDALGGLLERARRDSGFSGVRCWGEMSHVLYQRGDRKAALATERLAHAITAQPAEDYVRHRLAVNQAVAEVIGEIRGTMLQSLLSWQGLGCELSSSQALLFWLRETLPEQFHEVLSRARTYHLREAA